MLLLTFLFKSKDLVGFEFLLLYTLRKISSIPKIRLFRSSKNEKGTGGREKEKRGIHTQLCYPNSSSTLIYVCVYIDVFLAIAMHDSFTQWLSSLIRL